jgi:hypothetical protein
MTDFADELEALIERELDEDDEESVKAVISALEFQLAALKEEHSKK